MTEKCFRAEDASLSEVLEFVETELEKAECPIKTAMSVSVAIEEVFVNVAHYAYGEGVGEVRIGIGFDAQTLTFTFVVSDKGTPFDPLKKPDPDVTLPPEERQIGGLGIFIAKKTMDSIEYTYKNSENILTMKKMM